MAESDSNVWRRRKKRVWTTSYTPLSLRERWKKTLTLFCAVKKNECGISIDTPPSHLLSFPNSHSRGCNDTYKISYLYIYARVRAELNQKQLEHKGDSGCNKKTPIDAVTSTKEVLHVINSVIKSSMLTLHLFTLVFKY